MVEVAMKGLLLQLFEDFAKERWGAPFWYEALRDATGSEETVFVLPADYPFDQFRALTRRTAERAGMDLEQVLRTFGTWAFPRLLERYADLVRERTSAKAFLLDLDGFIHDEMRKVHPEAELPTFAYEDPGGSRLVMMYRSPRKLCALATGLLEGVAAWFGETVRYEHVLCMRRGDRICRFEIAFSSPPGAAP